MAPLFADIAKSSKDLLSDDYGSKVTVKAKIPAGPATLTLETERVSKGGAVSLASKVSTKVAPSFLPKGFAIDKFQMKPDGSNALETSLKGVAPGLKLTFKGTDSSSGDLGMEYVKGKVAATAVLDVVELSKISTSACYGCASKTVGASATYSMAGKECALSSYSLGGAYSTGALTISATTASKLSEVNVNTLYKASPALTVATASSHSSDKALGKFEVGCAYRAPVGLIKTKVDSAGLVSGACVKKIDNYTVTASGSVSSSDLSTFKWGLGVSI